jgi:uncharacterized protein (TIGR01244 family)
MKKLILILAAMVAINAQAQVAKPKLKVVKRPPYTQMLFQHENIFIGPQPQYKDFATLKAAGFNKVINMRTPKEMKELKFYEDYLLKKAGIDYNFIPIGGKDNPYSPEKLAEFAAALENTDGKILLHCRSGHRASQLWAAYLVKYKGKTIDEALAMVTDMGWWPMPMESLLDKKLHVSIKK